MNKLFAQLNVAIRSIDEDARTIEFLGSTPGRDRADEVIEVAGWDLRNYKKNPVFLWAHQYNMPPVGKAINVKKAEEGLIFNIEFADAETYPFADTIFRLYQGEFLRATSVGFLPITWEDGDGKKVPRRTYKKQELLELSACPVPMNAEALAQAVQNSVITAKAADEFTARIGDVIDPADDNEPDIPSDRQEYEKPGRNHLGEYIGFESYALTEEEEKELRASPGMTKPGFEETENEVRYRIREPGLFKDGSFRRLTLKKDKPRVFAIGGRLKSDNSFKLQALRFPKEDEWTIAKARTWVKEHPDVGKTIEDIDYQAYKIETSDKELQLAGWASKSVYVLGDDLTFTEVSVDEVAEEDRKTFSKALEAHEPQGDQEPSKDYGRALMEDLRKGREAVAQTSPEASALREAAREIKGSKESK